MSRTRRKLLVAFVSILALHAGNRGRAQSDELSLQVEEIRTVSPENALVGDKSPPVQVESNRWLLLACGLPGDADHRERLTDAVSKISNAAETVLGVNPDKTRRVLVSDPAMGDALHDQLPDASECTKESMQTTLQELAALIQPADSLTVILLGHGQLYKRRSTFNVQGPDFDSAEFAKWVQPIHCRQRVFLLTMPTSGFWLKPLRAENTVVISATEADLEFTATEMPYALADVLDGQGIGVQTLEDIDQDGQLSMLDLYLAVNIEIHNRFSGAEQLQTEHAKLDDNGDGIGKELQVPYLPSEDSEDKPAVRPDRIATKNSDGDLARRIILAAKTASPPSRVDDIQSDPGEATDDEATNGELQPEPAGEASN